MALEFQKSRQTPGPNSMSIFFSPKELSNPINHLFKIQTFTVKEDIYPFGEVSQHQADMVFYT